MVGKTTALLKSLAVMDSIMDIAGPLGTPTPIEKKGHHHLRGRRHRRGGVAHPITRGFHEAGNKVIGIIGARTKDLLIMEDKMQKATDELFVCTDDGSYGHHGFVTDVLREQLTKLGSAVKEAVCIGPVPMMKFCCKVTEEFGVPTMVSLNAIMVDGTGMCGCCRVQVGGETRFACVDGPEFDGHKVDFEGLSKRLGAYVPQEREAMGLYERKCSCGKQG